MSAPFASMEPARRARLTARSLAGVVGLGVVMLRVARPMRAGGHDIVPFEIAGDAATVDRIIEDWGPDGVRAARVQTVMDMGYLALYAVSTASGCATVAAEARSEGRDAVAAVGDVLGWAAVVAAGCDAVENASMLAELQGARGPLPALARRCALVKFGLTAPAVLYCAVGLIALRVGRGRWTAPT